MGHDSDATRVAVDAGSGRARWARSATSGAEANDPDATQVVARGNVASRTPSVDAAPRTVGGGAAAKPSDTAAMPGLHEAQQEVRYEAQVAQQQARAARAGYGGAAPYAGQPGAASYGSPRPMYPQQPYGQQPQPEGYGYSNPAAPQAQAQGYVGVAPNQYGQPQGQPYAQPYGQGYAAPRQVEPVGHGRHVGARFVLALFSWVFRLAAIAISVVVVLDSFTLAAGRMELLRATAFVSSLVPAPLSGLYVIDTPFGGAFRGDFAIMALALFVIDWILCRVRAALR